MYVHISCPDETSTKRYMNLLLYIFVSGYVVIFLFVFNDKPACILNTSITHSLSLSFSLSLSLSLTHAHTQTHTHTYTHSFLFHFCNFLYIYALITS